MEEAHPLLAADQDGGGLAKGTGTCAICLERILIQETALIKGCEHAYWMTSSQSAPLSAPTRTVVANWTDEQEMIFINILVERVKKGELVTSTFSKKSWNEICDDFFNKSNKSYDIFKLKNKYNKLRQRYKNFKSLITESGLGWDPTTNNVVADDSIWKNENYKGFKTKGCPEYPKLCIIFGDTTATGDRAWSINQEYSAPDSPPMQNRDHSESSDDVVETQMPTMSHSNRTATNAHGTSNTTSKRRRSLSGAEKLAEAITTLGNAKYGKGEYSSTSMDDPYSMEKCMEILMEMENSEDIEVEMIVKAAEKLKDRATREMFKLMSATVRKCWVKNM